VIAAATGVAAAALSVSPVRLRLAGAAARTIAITNPGGAAAAVEVRTASFVLDHRGRPMLARGRQPAAGWLRLRPARLVLAAGGTAKVAVLSATPANARPGDHPALVLLTTQPPRTSSVAIRVRIGVIVFVRVPGRIVHRLVVGALRARRRVLAAVVANRGKVVERTRVRLSLWRGGHALVRLGSVRVALLPHSRAVERFRYRGSVRGWVTARVELGARRWSFRVRL
jgi:hypothetical protein